MMSFGDVVDVFYFLYDYLVNWGICYHTVFQLIGCLIASFIYLLLLRKMLVTVEAMSETTQKSYKTHQQTNCASTSNF